MFRYSIVNLSEGGDRKVDDEESGDDCQKHLPGSPESAKPEIPKPPPPKPSSKPDRQLLWSRGYILMNERLGEGSYSKVKRAFCKYTNQDVAVKVVNRNLAPKDFLQRFLPRELEIVGHLNHPNICKYMEVFDTGSKAYVIMEYACNGDLLEYIQKFRYVEESMARNMFSQIVGAIKYLHNKNILHRDLKCENILLTSNFKPLVTDFGFGKYLPDITDLNKTFCGSSAYAPIEILKGIPYDGRSAEVWSLGVILYVMTTGTMPYDDTNKTQQIKQMKNQLTFSNSRQNLSGNLQILIKEMLDLNASTRISINDIQRNDWLTAVAYDNGDIYSNDLIGDVSSLLERGSLS